LGLSSQQKSCLVAVGAKLRDSREVRNQSLTQHIRGVHDPALQGECQLFRAAEEGKLEDPDKLRRVIAAYHWLDVRSKDFIERQMAVVFPPPRPAAAGRGGVSLGGHRAAHA
jgi:hypothetical protein